MPAPVNASSIRKAADIPDDAILAAVRSCDNGIGASRWKVAALFPDVPEKIVLAKLCQLTRRNPPLLNGCCCGCRGDFTIEEIPDAANE